MLHKSHQAMALTLHTFVVLEALPYNLVLAVVRLSSATFISFLPIEQCNDATKTPIRVAERRPKRPEWASRVLGPDEQHPN